MTNTLAYNDTAKIMAVKSFIQQAPGINVTIFLSSLTLQKNNLDHFNSAWSKKLAKYKHSSLFTTPPPCQ
jgi:hypothetical protein